MRVLVLDETRPGERRVALVPDDVDRLQALGLDVAVVEGAGAHAFHDDHSYRAHDADVVPAHLRSAALGRSDVVLSIRPLDPADAALLSPDAVTLSFLQPVGDLDTVVATAEAGASALSFELVPRISRAQSMDALTSQALVAGYRAGLVAAEHLPRFFPLYMTAAGTIPPARVVVLGAGVAGLQAIATARRLGAVVSAYDVRASSADEVRSMGATFIDLDLDALEGGGGYAREMTEDRAERQRELLAPFIAAADAVITTAAVPGRPAPLLVTREMVEAMKPGSVVVDLAAETGGNVEGSVPGSTVAVGAAIVWGGQDVPSQMPIHASQLYSSNVTAVLKLITAEGSVTLDLDDEIVAGSCVVHRGEIRNEAALVALGPADPTDEEAR
jgi:H+-translocating NAD(P) transhydrogenase subunit alpha